MGRVEDLEVALQNALELAQEGWAYAGDYFVKKWDYVERERNLTAVLRGAPVPRLPNGEMYSAWPFPYWKDDEVEEASE